MKRLRIVGLLLFAALFILSSCDVLGTIDDVVNEPPVPDAGGDQSVLVGTLVELNASASSDPDNDSLSFSWNLIPPAGSSIVLSNSNLFFTSFTPDVAGTYLVELTVSDGFDEAQARAIIRAEAANDNQAPVGTFDVENSTTRGTIDLATDNEVTLNFIATAVDADGTIANYIWDFGDGSPAFTETSGSVDHTYSANEVGELVFDLSVIVEDDGGSRSTIGNTPDVVISVINSDPAPIAQFSYAPNTVKVGDVVSFTDGSQVLDQDGVNDRQSTSWDFGDGLGSSVLEDPIYTYAAAGSYTVTLTVTDVDGLSDSFSKTVVVSAIGENPPPVAAFDFSPTKVDLAVSGVVDFFDKSSLEDAAGLPDADSYLWDFGDGSTSAVQGDVSHTYDAVGVYTVTLRVTDNDNLSDEYSVNIQVVNSDPPPKASFEPSLKEADAGTFIKFTDYSESVDQNNVSDVAAYEWRIINAATDVEIFSSADIGSIEYQFNNPGVYAVVLTVTDTDGLSDSFDTKITISGTGGVSAEINPAIDLFMDNRGNAEDGNKDIVIGIGRDKRYAAVFQFDHREIEERLSGSELLGAQLFFDYFRMSEKDGEWPRLAVVLKAIPEGYEWDSQRPPRYEDIVNKNFSEFTFEFQLNDRKTAGPVNITQLVIDWLKDPGFNNGFVLYAIDQSIQDRFAILNSIEAEQPGIRLEFEF